MGFPGLPTDHVWYSLGKFGWANVKWCEATLMGWVTEPANTWSNLAMIIFGIMILNKKKVEHKLLRIMPWALISLGFLSGFYHATNAWITQLGDFLGMYLVASIPLLINMERLGFKKASSYNSYIVLNLFGVLITAVGYYIGFPIQIIFSFIIFGILVTEALLWKTSPPASYQNLIFTMIALTVAGSFSLLDATRTMCDPDNHIIQGHALWHCFSGLGVYFTEAYCRDALNPKTNVRQEELINLT